MREQLGVSSGENDEPVNYRVQSSARILERLRTTRRFFKRKVYRFVARKQPPAPELQRHGKQESHMKQQEVADESYRTPARKLMATEFKVASTAATAQPTFEKFKVQQSGLYTGLKRDRYSRKVYYFLPREMRRRTTYGHWDLMRPL